MTRTTVEVIGDIWKYIDSPEKISCIVELLFPNGTVVSYRGKEIASSSLFKFMEMLKDYGCCIRGSYYDRLINAVEQVIGDLDYVNELKTAVNPSSINNSSHDEIYDEIYELLDEVRRTTDPIRLNYLVDCIQLQL